MVKNPPCNAEDSGLIPDQGTKIPQAAGQLSPRAKTTEPIHCNESILHDTTKIPRATTKTQRSQISKLKKQTYLLGTMAFIGQESWPLDSHNAFFIDSLLILDIIFH